MDSRPWPSAQPSRAPRASMLGALSRRWQMSSAWCPWRSDVAWSAASAAPCCLSVRWVGAGRQSRQRYRLRPRVHDDRRRPATASAHLAAPRSAFHEGVSVTGGFFVLLVAISAVVCAVLASRWATRSAGTFPSGWGCCSGPSAWSSQRSSHCSPEPRRTPPSPSGRCPAGGTDVEAREDAPRRLHRLRPRLDPSQGIGSSSPAAPARRVGGWPSGCGHAASRSSPCPARPTPPSTGPTRAVGTPCSKGSGPSPRPLRPRPGHGRLRPTGRRGGGRADRPGLRTGDHDARLL